MKKNTKRHPVAMVTDYIARIATLSRHRYIKKQKTCVLFKPSVQIINWLLELTVFYVVTTEAQTSEFKHGKKRCCFKQKMTFVNWAKSLIVFKQERKRRNKKRKKECAKIYDTKYQLSHE